MTMLLCMSEQMPHLDCAHAWWCFAVCAGGELQRVAIALCLGQPADIYLIDEPSAYLDSEQRIMASKVGC
jgi:ABC-type phosphate/phosphonate transport system ATPase subunit